MERIKEYAWCCGAGGGVYESYPELARMTAADRLAEAEATGADAIVSACPWCERSFTDGAASTGSKLKVLDIVTLAGRALGLEEES
jgi:Fe-S oxidoreductase